LAYYKLRGEYPADTALLPDGNVANKKSPVDITDTRILQEIEEGRRPYLYQCKESEYGQIDPEPDCVTCGSN
jgi:hypothetical protein